MNRPRGAVGSGTVSDMLVETARLVIRPWRHRDAPALLDLYSRPEVARSIGHDSGALLGDLDEAFTRIDHFKERSEPPYGFWAVELTAGETVIGASFLTADGHPREAEIGVHLHPAYWRRGYASEIGEALLAHAFGREVTCIHAQAPVDNPRAQSLCLRLGMKEDQPGEGARESTWTHFTLLADDWAHR